MTRWRWLACSTWSEGHYNSSSTSES